MQENLLLEQLLKHIANEINQYFDKHHDTTETWPIMVDYKWTEGGGDCRC